MHSERLGDLGTAAEVLRAVAAQAARSEMPPPAALVGEWFDSKAVIAPSISIEPVDPAEVFEPSEMLKVAPDSRADAIGGGWIGYLSYPDGGSDTEAGAPRIPQAAGGWTNCVLRLDREGCWWYESLAGVPMAKWLIIALQHRITPVSCEIDWQEPDFEQHQQAVRRCLEAISAGEVYQACVCTQFVGQVSGEPLDFFADAIARLTPARAAFVAGSWGAVASLSPELFIRRVGTCVRSSPIKGTLPLDAHPDELRASVKDVAENIMIVDLVRNDLGRVAATGSVTVPELLAVQPAPGVWHLVSTVQAHVDAGLSNSALLAATFPPASVTGTPKHRARQLLSQWEESRRGVYCGTVGMASPISGLELNVAIRTVEFDAFGGAVLGVGGGITADSNPGAEWQECLHKAAPIVGQALRARSTAS